jgi:ribosome-binding ATPase
VKNTSKGKSLGNQFLANIHTVDALIHAMRCFENSNIIHVSSKVDALADIEAVDTDPILANFTFLN